MFACAADNGLDLIVCYFLFVFDGIHSLIGGRFCWFDATEHFMLKTPEGCLSDSRNIRARVWPRFPVPLCV